jgi:hypothetical protein
MKINLDTDLMENKAWKQKHYNVEIKSVTFLVVLLVVALIVAGHDFASKEPVPQPKIEMLKSHGSVLNPRHVALTAFFARKGSPDPQRMATAVLETKRPRLMAAIAVRESGGNPKAVGDGGKSKGAFQVQDRHHGRVSSDPVEQALQSERVLNELIAENNGNLKKALNAYNGDTRRKVYAQNILSELSNVP